MNWFCGNDFRKGLHNEMSKSFETFCLWHEFDHPEVVCAAPVKSYYVLKPFAYDMSLIILR